MNVLQVTIDPINNIISILNNGKGLIAFHLPPLVLRKLQYTKFTKFTNLAIYEFGDLRN
jgi:hypothetical protein